MKKIYLLIAAAISLTLMVSCGKKSEIVQSELVDALLNGVAFSETLTELGSAEAEKRFYLNPNEYSEITAYVGTKATCDEIVVIKSSNNENVESKLRGHLETLKNNYSSYRPAEAQKIDSAVLEQYKDTVVLVVSGDSANVRSIYENYLKK